jgi:hypothetical protein
MGCFEVIYKHASLSLHDVSPSRLRHITSLVCQGIFPPTDKCGGMQETWCEVDGLKVQMKEHIMSYPF